MEVMLEDLNNDNYKILNMELKSPVSARQKELISIVNEEFPNRDIYIEISDNELRVYLRSIDLNKLKKMSEDVQTYFGIISEDENILDKIIEKIETIKSYGLKGGKRLFVGYQKERRVKDRKQKEKARGKYYYANKAAFSKIDNNVPKEFLDKIICDDSQNILKELPTNCIDLIFTSPPYNFGLGYDNHYDGIDWNNYFDKLFSIIHECIRILKYGGRFVINIQPLFSDYIPIHHIISNYLMESGLIWKAEILWEKHNYNCKYTAWGSWKSPSNPYFKYTWEFIEVFSKGNLTHKGQKKHIDVTAEEFKSWVYAKWDIAPEKNMKEWGHPAVFPEELARRVIKLLSY